MRTLLSIMLTSAAAVALPSIATAQTRKPAPKSVAKPVARPVAKPASKPAPVPRAAAAPTPAPAPAPAPAPVARAAASGDKPFDVGTNVVNLGIGLGNRYGYGTGFFGGNSSVFPAISVSYERGIMPLGPGVLGVGIFAGYQGASYSLGGDKWKYTDVIVTLRGAFHYPVLPQFDAYGGVGLGLRHAGVSSTGSGVYNFGESSFNELALGLFAGGRYYFTPRIGAFAELGYDQTYLKVGVAAKF